jgi:hypothetical protein
VREADDVLGQARQRVLHPRQVSGALKVRFDLPHIFEGGVHALQREALSELELVILHAHARGVGVLLLDAESAIARLLLSNFVLLIDHPAENGACHVDHFALSPSSLGLQF